MNTLNYELPLISYVIPAHNVESVLERCVDSIVLDANEVQIYYEILIIENGSTDGTYIVAESLGSVL